MGRYRFENWLDYILACVGCELVAGGCGKYVAMLGAALLFVTFTDIPKRRKGP
jgi:hypothetical protein